MEFETNTPANDEARRLAESKKLTLQPLHADTTPDERPDTEIVAKHIIEGPVANLANDSEETSKTMQGAPTDASELVARHAKPVDELHPTHPLGDDVSPSFREVVSSHVAAFVAFGITGVLTLSLFFISK